MVKPEIIVAPDEYILTANGPYFSDARNNVATILLRDLENDVNGMRNWFEEGDIVIVDRCYRDAFPTFEELGLISYMTPLLHCNQRQLSLLVKLIEQD